MRSVVHLWLCVVALLLTFSLRLSRAAYDSLPVWVTCVLGTNTNHALHMSRTRAVANSQKRKRNSSRNIYCSSVNAGILLSSTQSSGTTEVFLSLTSIKNTGTLNSYDFDDSRRRYLPAKPERQKTPVKAGKKW